MVDKKVRRKSSRGTGKMFAVFDSKQIQELKEAFTMIDQDRDGVIGSEDLKEIYMSLGKNISDAEVKSMLGEAPGPINFTAFLTMFGEKLSGTDPEETILKAFKMFDPSMESHISTQELKTLLTTNGPPDNRMSERDFSQLLVGAPVDSKGFLDYVSFARIITKGPQDEE